VKTSLEEAWIHWKNCLSSFEDENSIFNQIITMVWDTAIYRVILRGRQARLLENPEKPQINTAFHSLIDRNYIQAQCTTIRRLVDNSKYSTMYGDRSVYSLGVLIGDIEKRKVELTRSLYLKLHKMPYDYSEIQKNEREFFFERRFNENLFTLPPELDWQEIMDAHQQFDRLSHVTPETRSPENQINKRVFVGLRAQLSKCEPIVKHVDKFIAHSSTPESRSIIQDPKITLEQIWGAQKILYEVANFLGVSLFLVDTIPLPIESYAFYSHWDKSLFLEEEERQIRDVYEEYQDETDDWRLNNVENIWKVIEEQ